MGNGIIPLSGGGRVALEIGDNWEGKVPLYIYSVYVEKNIVIKDSKIFFLKIHSTNCLLIIRKLTLKSLLRQRS